MRRLVLEILQEDIEKFSPSGGLLEKIDSLEVIHHLKFDKNGYAGICRVRPKDPELDLKRLVGTGGLARLEPLYEDNGAQVVYWETRTPTMAWFKGPDAPNVYLCPPIEFKDRKLKLTFLGTLNEVKKLLMVAERVGQRFKVLSLSDPSFAPATVLQGLTEKQRQVFSAAYSHGYYDVPRRIDSDELAKKLHTSKSTLVEHLRKAEKRLAGEIMGEKEEVYPLPL